MSTAAKTAAKTTKIEKVEDVSSRGVARVTASSKPMSWADGKKVLTRAERELTSANPETVRAAIGELKNIKFDFDSFKSLPPGEYNEKMLRVVDNLVNYAQSGKATPALQREAVEAVLQYSRVNSGNYRFGFLERRAPEVFGELYYNPSLPDNVRQLVHAELSRAYQSAGFGEFPAFRSSESMMEEFTRTGHVSGPRW